MQFTLLHDRPLSRRSADKQLILSLERLVRDFSPTSLQPGGGLYVGPLSIALLFFVLAKHYEDLKIDNISLTAWFDSYLETGTKIIGKSTGPSPDRCGIGDDMMSLLALKAASAKHPIVAKRLCEYVGVVTMPGASNEWLYGRAGYLYLLRLVRSSFRR